jgi:hypothetical protein
MNLKCFSGHQWNGCKCKRCGEISNAGHQWVLIENKCIEKCAICGKERDLRHEWMLWEDKCIKKCAVCGKERTMEHEWNGDTCKKCGATRSSEPLLTIADGTKMPGSDDRHGCLTTWLILLVVVNMIMAIYVISSHEVEIIAKVLSAVNAFVVILSVVLLWDWKKVGFWIFTGLTIVSFIVGLATGEFLEAFRGIIPLAILWGVLQQKKGDKSAWENMR